MIPRPRGWPAVPSAAMGYEVRTPVFEGPFDLLLHLYGQQYDFFYHLETILETAARMWVARPEELKALDALREAVKKADFETVRGKFSFSANQHPVQDMYIREVVKTENGTYTNKTLKAVFKDHSNVYVEQCKMK